MVHINFDLLEPTTNPVTDDVPPEAEVNVFIQYDWGNQVMSYVYEVFELGSLVFTEGDLVYSSNEFKFNNFSAIYVGLDHALTDLLPNYRDKKIIIYSNSQIAVKQLTGEYKVDYEKYYFKFFNKVENTLKQFKNCKVFWKRTDKNDQAYRISLNLLNLSPNDGEIKHGKFI